MTGKLTAGADGRVTGPADITHNDPWSCVNGNPGGMSVPHGIQGLIVHTMVGNLPGTIEVFNRPSFQASAHFGVGQSGAIHQFGSVRGWKAWAQAAGNPHWYSCEFADDGNPDNPLTQAQVTAGAQLLECLSAPGVGNFPLQVTNSVSGEGLGVHFMGGQPWGGHTCPDVPPAHVRSAQRPQIVALAMAIRSGTAPGPATKGWAAKMIADLPELAEGADDAHQPHWYVHRAQLLANGVFGAKPAVPVTGKLDAATVNALKVIQRDFKIPQTGKLDAATWALLLAGQHG